MNSSPATSTTRQGLASTGTVLGSWESLEIPKFSGFVTNPASIHLASISFTSTTCPKKTPALSILIILISVPQTTNPRTNRRCHWNLRASVALRRRLEKTEGWLMLVDDFTSQRMRTSSQVKTPSTLERTREPVLVAEEGPAE